MKSQLFREADWRLVSSVKPPSALTPAQIMTARTRRTPTQGSKSSFYKGDQRAPVRLPPTLKQTLLHRKMIQAKLALQRLVEILIHHEFQIHPTRTLRSELEDPHRAYF